MTPQNQPIQEPTVTLELPLSAVGVVMAGLNELPRKFSHVWCDEIDRQVQFQLAAAQAKQERGALSAPGTPLARDAGGVGPLADSKPT